MHRRSGENRDYDKEDLETFDSELTTPEVRVGGDRGLIKYECAPCDETFASSVLLNLHKTNTHNLVTKTPKQYNCTSCPFQSDNPMEQLRHSRKLKHTPTVVTEKCVLCGKSFPRIEALMEHRGQAHPSSKKCNFFPFNKNTGEECLWGKNCCYKHENEELTADSIFSCNSCDLFFKVKGHFMHHLKSVHPESVRNCNSSECQRSEHTCWFKHVKEDTVDTGNLECSECNFTCKNKPDVMLHKKKEHTNMVKKCANPNCARNEKTCWYSHAQKKKSVHFNQPIPMETDESTDKPVFQRGRKSAVSPEIATILKELTQQLAKMLQAGEVQTS